MNTGKKRILIIDDNLDILEVLKMTLEDAEYEVLTSPDGENAVNIVGSFSPNLILLDVLLSGKDGREICKMLKATDTTKDVPIVIIAANPDFAMSALESGAEEFLEKPFSLDNLLSTVANHIL